MFHKGFVVCGTQPRLQDNKVRFTLFRAGELMFIGLSIIEVRSGVRPIVLTGGYRNQMDIRVSGLTFELIIIRIKDRRTLFKRLPI